MQSVDKELAQALAELEKERANAQSSIDTQVRPLRPWCADCVWHAFSAAPRWPATCDSDLQAAQRCLAGRQVCSSGPLLRLFKILSSARIPAHLPVAPISGMKALGATTLSACALNPRGV